MATKRNVTKNVADKLTQDIVQEKASAPDINTQAQIQLMAAERRRVELRKIYAEEEKVPMYLAPLYQPYFGKIMQVMINGVCIAFRVDGSTQMVPQSFADEINERRIKVDAILNKQNKMSNIQNNLESAPGELALF